MTFRPSVLPDRDNDILSTFTRSFERARQLVRQDQADRRAQQLHDLDVRERERAIEDREFQAAMELATTPGIETRTGARRITPQQQSIIEAFGRDRQGGVVDEVRAPRIGRFGRAVMPRELMPPPGTAGDTRVVGERGGQQVTFSQMMADRLRREREMAEAEFEETLPAGRRAAEDRRREEDTVRALLEADPLETGEGEDIPPESITSPEIAMDLIEQQREARFARERGVAVATAPRTTNPRTTATTDPSVLPSATGARVNAILRDVEEEARDRLIAEAGIEANLRGFTPREFTPAERESMRRESVVRAFNTGVITQQQRDALLARGAGEAPLSQEEVSSLLQRFRGMSDDDVREIMQSADFTSPEIEQFISERTPR